MNKKNIIKFILTVLTIALNIGFLGYAQAASTDDLIKLTNISREKYGLNNLIINEKLSIAATKKANDMFNNQYFAHISPTGKTPWDFLQSAGYEYIHAGENLSIGFVDNQELHNAWMTSPSHKANIMNANYDEIGMAVASGKYQGSETTIVVQMFGKEFLSKDIINSTEPVNFKNNTNIDTEVLSAQTINQKNDYVVKKEFHGFPLELIAVLFSIIVVIGYYYVYRLRKMRLSA